jgi:uncharacterized protein YcbK (DUF882 family)
MKSSEGSQIKMDCPETSKLIKSTAVNRRSLLKLAVGATSLLKSRSAFAGLWKDRDRSLHMINPHTGESFRDVYWSRGSYIKHSLSRINWLMRDYHVDEVERIDPGLVDLLHAVARRVDAKAPLELLSGFRTVETNERLQEEGYNAAPHSMHLVARAADIRAPGVHLPHLYRAALSLRRGGVGFYPSAGFIHVDTGALRRW